MKLKWLPNAICMIRIVLVAPLIGTLLHGQYMAALVLVIVAGGSDALDGFLAKTFDWRSRLGSLLDPAADKLLVIGAFATLSHIGIVPVALTAIVVLRDVVIVGGAIAYQLCVEPVRGEPLLISKLNTACELAFLLLTMAHSALVWPQGLVLPLLGAVVVFTSITSGVAYMVAWGRRAHHIATGHP